MLDVLRPSDGQRYAEVPVANRRDRGSCGGGRVAGLANGDWAPRAVRERAKVLQRWADLVDADGATLGPLEPWARRVQCAT